MGVSSATHTSRAQRPPEVRKLALRAETRGRPEYHAQEVGSWLHPHCCVLSHGNRNRSTKPFRLLIARQPRQFGGGPDTWNLFASPCLLESRLPASMI